MYSHEFIKNNLYTQVYYNEDTKELFRLYLIKVIDIQENKIIYTYTGNNGYKEYVKTAQLTTFQLDKQKHRMLSDYYPELLTNHFSDFFDKELFYMNNKKQEEYLLKNYIYIDNTTKEIRKKETINKNINNDQISIFELGG